jgi:hypothetical protein
MGNGPNGVNVAGERLYLFLSPVMDLYNREIIFYEVATRPTQLGGYVIGAPSFAHLVVQLARPSTKLKRRGRERRKFAWSI